jgi:hypothetical protein
VVRATEALKRRANIVGLLADLSWCQALFALITESARGLYGFSTNP